MLSRSEDAALLLGRLFIAALFLPSGFAKLMAFSTFAASLAAKGVPYPVLLLACWWPQSFRPFGSDHRPVATMDGFSAHRFHSRHPLDDIRPIRDGTDLPPPPESGVLPKSRDHRGIAVLFRQWAGRMRPDQPSVRLNEGQQFLNLPYAPCTLKGAVDGCWIKPV